MVFGKFAMAIMLLLSISGTAGAFLSGLEQKITVGEQAYTLTFYVQNDSQVKQPLQITYTLPSEFKILTQPEWVGAKGREKVSVLIYPKKGLEGSIYMGTISAQLGGNIAQKNIVVAYVNENGCPVQAKTIVADDGNVAITVENQAYASKSLELKGISGIPSDWKLKGETIMEIGAFEKREFSLAFERGSSFSGDAEFKFMCNGNEFSEIAPVKFEQKGIPSAVFAVISGAVSDADRNFVLDMFLVIVASILLIAFIARAVNVASKGAGQGGK